jgi:hypothetical protein
MNGLTQHLAAGILLIHVAIAIVYIVLVVCLGWSCYGLRSLYEVVTISINSPKSEMLENTSAGISRMDTYKHIVKLRETSNTQLGFMLDDDGRLKLPVDGKKYGRVVNGSSDVVDQTGSELSTLVPGDGVHHRSASSDLSVNLESI